MSLFVSYHLCSDLRYDTVLLGLSPMENKERLNANEHYKFITFLLSIFSKEKTNVVCVQGDNCNTNKLMCRRIGSTFVACHIQRFNLDVRDIINQHEDVIYKVQLVMKKQSCQVPPTKCDG